MSSASGASCFGMLGSASATSSFGLQASEYFGMMRMGNLIDLLTTIFHLYRQP
jgi:hypothetical protein